MLAAAILSAIAGAILITWFLKRTTKRRAEIAFYTALLLTSPGIGDELVIIITKGSPKREEAVAWISLIQKMSAHHGVIVWQRPIRKSPCMRWFTVRMWSGSLMRGSIWRSETRNSAAASSPR